MAHHSIVGNTFFARELNEFVKLCTKTNGVNCCTGSALITQQCHGDHPATIHFANNTVFRAAGVGKKDFVKFRVARHHANGSHFNTWLTHVNEQESNSAMLHFIGRCAGENENMVCHVATGVPGLLPVNDPLITVEHCTTTEVAQVAACCRLTKTLAPQVFARQHSGKVMLLLFFSSDSQKRVAQHADTKHVVRANGGHAYASKFFRDDRCLNRGEPLTAVFLWPVHCQETIVAQCFAPCIGKSCSFFSVECANSLPACR